MKIKQKVTRGSGLLEDFLSKQRAMLANKLIRYEDRKGRILDLGCGQHPYFLCNTNFSEKFGLDKLGTRNNAQINDIRIFDFDLEKTSKLPFNNNYFDVVTMLAVFEHINTDKLPEIIDDIFRILKPGGLFIMTTPAGWTDKLLKIMANLNLVSIEEIEEHEEIYNHDKIFKLLNNCGFRDHNINQGFFELYTNLWATAQK